MSEQSTVGPLSHKRRNQDLYSGLIPGPSEHPMEIEDSGDTASEHENGNQEKMKKSDSKEKLGIESEKSKVKFSN